MLRLLAFLFFVFFQFIDVFARALETEESLWDLGLGLSYMKVEHYPGSKDFTYLLVPFPTAEYRGKSARVEQSEGARAFLYKNATWALDLSGAVFPGQNFAKDEARSGMGQLPWMMALGPQLVIPIIDAVQFRTGLFPVLSFGSSGTRAQGLYYDARVVFSNQAEVVLPFSFIRHDYLSLSLQGASQEFMATYYNVPVDAVTSDRPFFQSKNGLVSAELGFYETFTRGNETLYAGAYYSDYSRAANNQSPLLKSDRNFTFFIAYGLTFAKSKRKSYELEETQGLFNRFF